MKKIHWFTDKDALATPQGELYIKNKDVIKQILKVLKLEEGENIIVRTSGAAFGGVIHSVTSFEIILNQIEEVVSHYPQKQASLFFCIPKKDKFELILEKCTELGITNFYPIISDRTIKTNINIERAQKIIEEACEQAQRTDTPVLHEIRDLEEIIKEFRPVVFDVDGGILAKDEALHIHNFLIGPEGGFSEKEIMLFKKEKLDIYKLKTPVLKTETAAIAVTSLLLID
jgi:16S rRNA (uracil1498-N3)-methyltransferase